MGRSEDYLSLSGVVLQGGEGRPSEGENPGLEGWEVLSVGGRWDCQEVWMSWCFLFQ